MNNLKIAKKIQDHLREATSKKQDISHIMRCFCLSCTEFNGGRWGISGRSCGRGILDQNILYERKFFSVEENSESILEEKHC